VEINWVAYIKRLRENQTRQVDMSHRFALVPKLPRASMDFTKKQQKKKEEGQDIWCYNKYITWEKSVFESYRKWLLNETEQTSGTLYLDTEKLQCDVKRAR
jgi:hypothetical protein